MKILGGISTQNAKSFKIQSHSSVSDTLKIFPAKKNRTKLNTANESEGGFAFLPLYFCWKKSHFLGSVMCFGALSTHILSTFWSHSQGQCYCFWLWTVSAAQEAVISQINCAKTMESTDYQA